MAAVTAAALAAAAAGASYSSGLQKHAQDNLPKPVERPSKTDELRRTLRRNAVGLWLLAGLVLALTNCVVQAIGGWGALGF